MKKSSKYWKNRFLEIEKASNAYGQDAFREIEPAFDSAQRQIQNEIEKWYYRFAKNNQISIEEAKKMLSAKELKEFHWDVEEYIKYGRENAINQQWMKELENASARVHVSRLEALKIRTQQAAEVAFGNELDVIDDMARKVYTEDYYRTIFEMQKGFNIGWDIGTIDQKKLDKLIVKPWAADGKNFKDRIWNSKSQMVSELHQQLTRACVLGKAPDEAIEAMTKYVDKDIKNKKHAARRLVMTEQAYFHSVSQKDAFNDLDIEEYKIVATLDEDTSEICQEMDGKIFPMSQYEPGVTAPPFHVFCRSVTAPKTDGEFAVGQRIARGADGKTYYVPDDMTYKDWKKGQDAVKVLTNEGKDDKLKLGLQYFADIPKDKFLRYALDPDKQPDKAKAFKLALGYTKDNYQELIDNIDSNFDMKNTISKGSNNYGNLFECVMELTGANGKKANVCTGWIVEFGQTEPRLTSAYVTEKKVTTNEKN